MSIIAGFSVRAGTEVARACRRGAPGRPEGPVVIHQSNSIPTGLTELIEAHDASLVVVVVVGNGHDWRGAVEAVTWEVVDVLVLGSGAAGPVARVFLGSAASKIPRHAPVPVMIVPRHPSA